MREEPQGFRTKCDRCGEYLSNGEDGIDFYGPSAEDDMQAKLDEEGWHSDDVDDYCPECWAKIQEESE